MFYLRYEAFFKPKLNHLLEELETIRDKWDLVYIGRKILHNSVEDWLKGKKIKKIVYLTNPPILSFMYDLGSEQLVHVDYTYWTLAYILTKVCIQFF